LASTRPAAAESVAADPGEVPGAAVDGAAVDGVPPVAGVCELQASSRPAHRATTAAGASVRVVEGIGLLLSGSGASPP
jgi:hypothetical protein